MTDRGGSGSGELNAIALELDELRRQLALGRLSDPMDIEIAKMHAELDEIRAHLKGMGPPNEAVLAKLREMIARHRPRPIANS